MSKKDIDRHLDNLKEHTKIDIIHHGKGYTMGYTMVYAYYDRCIKRIENEIEKTENEEGLNILTAYATLEILKEELTNAKEETKP